MRELKINPIFRDLLDVPSDSERKELERQLVRDGKPRDPIVVWKDTIIDGHNRYAVCLAHKLVFDTIEHDFNDDEEAKMWILENQLARRNLSPIRSTYFMGLLYNSTKQDPSKVREATEDKVTTAEKLGERFNVSERTVRRAGDFAKGVDAVAAVKQLTTVKEKLAAIKDKNEGLTKGELIEIGKAPTPEVAKSATEALLKEKAAARAKLRTPDKKPAEAPKPAKKEVYPVCFVKPNFERANFSVASEERPPMADDCMVYIVVPDEELSQGMELLKKWGLKYEASFIFKCERYEGMWSDITHTFLLAASKGDPLPTPKKLAQSLGGSATPSDMLKLIEQYHPSVKRLEPLKP